MVIKEEPFRSYEQQGECKPLLLVKYINGHHPENTLDFHSFIDTGADCCVLPESFCEPLGHNYTHGTPVLIQGSTGKSKGYKHSTIMQIKGFKTQKVDVIFTDTVRKPLIGVSTFLSNFVLTIDYPNQYFSLEIPQKRESITHPF